MIPLKEVLNDLREREAKLSLFRQQLISLRNNLVRAEDNKETIPQTEILKSLVILADKLNEIVGKP